MISAFDLMLGRAVRATQVNRRLLAEDSRAERVVGHCHVLHLKAERAHAFEFALCRSEIILRLGHRVGGRDNCFFYAAEQAIEYGGEGRFGFRLFLCVSWW